MQIQDSWNKKLWSRCKRNAQCWIPPVAESAFLWTRFIGKSIWPAGYWIHHHMTEYLDIEFIEKGDMIIRHGNEKFLVKEQSAIIMPPGEYTLLTGSSGFCEKIYIGIVGSILNTNLKELGLNKMTIIPDFKLPLFEDTYRELLQLAVQKKQEKVIDYAALTYKLLLLISNKIKILPFPPELAKAKTFIDWNFSTAITLNDICQFAGCGKTTMQKHFSTFLGTAPSAYLISVRMKCAAALLNDSTMSIKNLSAKCGYENQLYFSNAFKKFYGISPRAYRKNLLMTDKLSTF